MRLNLRKITITLDEAVARWAGIEAARRGITVSGLIADLLRAQSTDENQYNLAMQEALTREPFLTSEGLYLSRQEANNRERLR